MVKLASAFRYIESGSKVMVIGDFLLDTYTIGKARRISPEAPVAVVHVQRQDHRPGGAGNVVLNLKSLGSDVVAVGRIGNDPSGRIMQEALHDEGIDACGFVVQQGFATPVKNRIIAENQQVVRVDHEEVIPFPEEMEPEVMDAVIAGLEGVKIIAISDYGKGFLTPTLLQQVIAEAKKRGIPVIVDPKGLDFKRYRGATMIKPNLKEAYAVANLPLEASLEEVADRIFSTTQTDMLMITRSEAGISLFHAGGQHQEFSADVHEVHDVTGAGDTVLAMVACALANGLPVEEAVQLSNVAAGIAIERFGCARVTLSEIARRLLEHDSAHKVFGEKHLFALQATLRDRPFYLLGVSEEHGLTADVFQAIRELGGECDLLLYVEDDNPSEEFVALLASLSYVNFIIVEEGCLRKCLALMTPSKSHTVAKGAITTFHLEENPVGV